MPGDPTRFKDGSEADCVAPPDASDLRDRIEALAEFDNVTLREAWQNAYRNAPPKGARKRFLLLGIARKWQAAAFARRLCADGHDLR